MTRGVAMLAAVVLFGLAALHVYWAVGGGWGKGVAVPGREDQKPAFVPGVAATLMVAVLLAAAGLVLLGRAGFWGQRFPRWLFVAGAWTLVVVFGGRLIGDRRWFGIFKRVTGTPFARWDTMLFVPVSGLLALAALFVAIYGG